MNQLGDMFKQFGGLKDQMQQAKQRVAEMRINGEAGAGMVKAIVTGENQLQSLEIDDDLLDKTQKDMLIELIISAVNDAGKKAGDAAAHEMKGMAGGLNIPGLDKILGSLGG